MLTRAQALASTLVGPMGRRWLHVQAVAARAAALSAPLLPADSAELLTSAAWLHDIGYSPTLIATGLHAVDGAAYLRRCGDFAPLVELLVAHHTGASVEAEERGLVAALQAFERPPSELLDVLTTADLVSGPSGQWVRAVDRTREILERYDAGSPVNRAVTRSEPELLAAVERVEQRLAAVGAPPAQPT